MRRFQVKTKRKGKIILWAYKKDDFNHMIEIWFDDRPLIQFNETTLGSRIQPNSVSYTAKDQLQKLFSALETLRQADLLATWHGEIYQDLRDNWDFKWLVDLWKLDKVSQSSTE